MDARVEWRSTAATAAGLGGLSGGSSSPSSSSLRGNGSDSSLSTLPPPPLLSSPRRLASRVVGFTVVAEGAEGVVEGVPPLEAKVGAADAFVKSTFRLCARYCSIPNPMSAIHCSMKVGAKLGAGVGRGCRAMTTSPGARGSRPRAATVAALLLPDGALVGLFFPVLGVKEDAPVAVLRKNNLASLLTL